MLKHISVFSKNIVVSALDGVDMADIDVFLRWGDIIGEELARLITPLKVTNSNLSKTLYVNVSRYELLEFEYSKNKILNRLNHFFGQDKFCNIKFIPR